MTVATTPPAFPPVARPDVLTTDQWNALQGIAGSLTASQALWASGYLFALSHIGTGIEAGAPAAAPTVSSAPTRTLTILYGSETGNCADISRMLADRAASGDLPATVVDMADYVPRRLKDEHDLLVVTSTHGDGDPPQSAISFFEFLEGHKAPRLPGLRFAVLALGDSSYEHFCAAGRRVDQRLEALGASRLHARVDCDVDFDAPASAWADAVMAALSPGQDRSARVHAGATVVPPPAPAIVDRRHPLPTTVLDNIGLTGRGSTKETRHVELSFPDGALRFSPGDSLGVVARNDPWLVGQILDALNLTGDTRIAMPARSTTLADALERDYEITTVTPRFIETWAKLTGATVLTRLADSSDPSMRATFQQGHRVLDVLRRFPAPGITAETLLQALRPLTPRLYSIASSQAAISDEVHLLVSIVRYTLNDLVRSGVASGHIADRLALSATLPVYVQPNPHFRLPADDAPILMIGAGTGIAPYRAFMQEREVRGATGRSWLVFGDRNFRTDFLYQLEWQDLLKRGVLTRMDVAFSRDAGDNAYVQHRLTERAHDVFAWLEEGAHIYVCGDAARMAPGVDEALTTIVERAGRRDRETAIDYLRALRKAHRYQRDVY